MPIKKLTVLNPKISTKDPPTAGPIIYPNAIELL